MAQITCTRQEGDRISERQIDPESPEIENAIYLAITEGRAIIADNMEAQYRDTGEFRHYDLGKEAFDPQPFDPENDRYTYREIPRILYTMGVFFFSIRRETSTHQGQQVFMVAFDPFNGRVFTAKRCQYVPDK